MNDGNLAETGKTFTKMFNLSNRKLNNKEKCLNDGSQIYTYTRKIIPTNWMMIM